MRRLNVGKFSDAVVLKKFGDVDEIQEQSGASATGRCGLVVRP
jgi:hypothetical protein